MELSKIMEDVMDNNGIIQNNGRCNVYIYIFKSRNRTKGHKKVDQWSNVRIRKK